MSEPLASPRGCRSLAERSSSAAELMAPAETTTTSAEYVSVASPRFTTRRVTSRPDAPVSSFVTWALVSRVTFGSRSAGSTQTTWASDLAPTRHGWPSQVSRRVRVRRARGRVRRVRSPLAVHVIEPFRRGVVGLEVLVFDRPRGRYPAPVLDLAEVLAAEAEERGSVELGVADRIR